MSNNKDYLYLLPFNCNQYFKIGISSNLNFDRVKGLNNIYSINLNESYIFIGEKKKIVNLERMLLTMFESTPNILDKFKNNDGYTEIREFIDYNNCFEEAKRLAHKLNLTIKPYKECLVEPNPKLLKDDLTIKLKQSCLSYNLKLIDDFNLFVLNNEYIFNSALTNKHLILKYNNGNNTFRFDDFKLYLNHNNCSFIFGSMLCDKCENEIINIRFELKPTHFTDVISIYLNEYNLFIENLCNLYSDYIKNHVTFVNSLT
jgi:hypothetical protein